MVRSEDEDFKTAIFFTCPVGLNVVMVKSKFWPRRGALGGDKRSSCHIWSCVIR